MRSVIRISLTYAVLAGLWVVFSDDFLLLMFRDPTRLIQYEKAKGLVFIVLSAALIYALASRHVRQIERGQALQSAKDREFRYLFLNNPLPMWVFDRETLRFLEVNEAALRKYGYTREEFLSMRISDIRPARGPAAAVPTTGLGRGRGNGVQELAAPAQGWPLDRRGRGLARPQLFGAGGLAGGGL